MTQIPSGTKFVGIASTVPTPENRSSQNNSFQEVYTLSDIQESVLDLTTPPNDGDVLTYDTGTNTPVWSAPTGGSDYTETIVNISSAQILAIGTTPIELLPAPGDGKYYDIEKVIVEFTEGSTPYSGDAIVGVSNPVNHYLESGSLAGATFYAILKPSPSIFNAVEELVFSYPTTLNRELNFERWSGTIADGDGTLRVKIYHKTITFGA